ncbi:MAG: mismatch-specific DNA-glycosylase [Arenicellales bacterium]|jgi:TDG/mug DNA glycosylase family protein|nr:mismatch-specific DNA-glycosylase [Gammaproteobacteria bacterium]NDA15117.1 mismatch-specific DNA-glycosylase [Gammaproteobacteria bacterium]NDG44085.1 mismatch-specific DNA-glycosylase [Gammaproteobacteria bacterium]
MSSRQRIVVAEGKALRTVPKALADLHASSPVGATLALRLAPQPEQEWNPQKAEDLLIGGGFELQKPVRFRSQSAIANVVRIESLPDTVGRSLKTLIVGLNPSPYSAQSAVPYGRPGNRFWPAVLAAGLASKDRDPWHALRHHGVGFTDLVRRTTRRAEEVSATEFKQGFERVKRLILWLKPKTACFVGLGAWRMLMQRDAVAGIQPVTLGVTLIYLMPHTSGLNASSRLEDLKKHFQIVRDLS